MLLLFPDLSAIPDRFSSRGKLDRWSSFFRASVNALTVSVPFEMTLSMELSLAKCPFKLLLPFWGQGH